MTYWHTSCDCELWNLLCAEIHARLCMFPNVRSPAEETLVWKLSAWWDWDFSRTCSPFSGLIHTSTSTSVTYSWKVMRTYSYFRFYIYMSMIRKTNYVFRNMFVRIISHVKYAYAWLALNYLLVSSAIRRTQLLAFRFTGTTRGYTSSTLVFHRNAKSRTHVSKRWLCMT